MLEAAAARQQLHQFGVPASAPQGKPANRGIEAMNSPFRSARVIWSPLPRPVRVSGQRRVRASHGATSQFEWVAARSTACSACAGTGGFMVPNGL